ncbi:unnamed protein product [Fusarium graminearum]|uniref:Chromosome 2, complete genome n=1 Tax=Gibberella zeae (strain ATCC MYA-4620 / CBS 123657 / FGSC 9075 / NRRL 31084 / PH-1) TaxID=229533 RepID=I1S900_GIBZE|nr:hypothetical protein FGSG_13330 [Fusarium graminearum PH-1]ESU14702.1 hypothetical protein FGSG_13330 [Fusarium graminearum PH-1]CAF3463871.1 unnamed protein product [Fusarium graminearum]CEF77002.1 unnamed protein product [Fusarium graminearum]CZS80294.1 unnamed protein product [Fusarium graminearum]|eukprot:XP_011320127.1 hypothetical protein FGSG_13330 [Fusarium graminearum PH-1]
MHAGMISHQQRRSALKVGDGPLAALYDTLSDANVQVTKENNDKELLVLIGLCVGSQSRIRLDNNYTNRPASCAFHDACCLFASDIRNGKTANVHSGVTPFLCLLHADNALSIVIRLPSACLFDT